jgi:hypothetical protein
MFMQGAKLKSAPRVPQFIAARAPTGWAYAQHQPGIANDIQLQELAK